MILFQNTQDSQVRESPRESAAQGYPDPGSWGWSTRAFIHLRLEARCHTGRIASFFLLPNGPRV